MTADTTQMISSETPPPRPIELVLAHAHLRLGMLPLARTELETIAAAGALDPVGLVDLAEVRWRTGDLVGAGDAAETALNGDTEDPVALVVASEAASGDGRPSDARRLAMRALAVAPGTIDLIFAGMSRSIVWGPDAYEPAPIVQTLFDRGPDPIPPGAESDPERPDQESATAQPTSPHPMTLGLWAGDEGEDPAASTLLEPAEAFDAGRTALVEGSFDEAAFRLGLALRLAPALAPAVLEITDGARARNLILLRGDAYRQAGHETEARQAYAIAARGGMPERRSRVRVKSTLSGADATAAAGLAPPSAKFEPDPPDETEAMAAAEEPMADPEGSDSTVDEPLAEAAPGEPGTDLAAPEAEQMAAPADSGLEQDADLEEDLAESESGIEAQETRPAVEAEDPDETIQDRTDDP
jgi:hypothetical protein